MVFKMWNGREFTDKTKFVAGPDGRQIWLLTQLLFFLLTSAMSTLAKSFGIVAVDAALVFF